MKKTVVSWLGAVVVVVSLVAACAAPAATPTKPPAAPAPAAQPTAAAPAAPAPTAPAAAAPAPAAKPAPVTLKFAHFLGPTGFYSDLYKWYAAEVEKRTEGRVKFQIYWSDSLVSQRDLLPGITSGAADLGIVSAAYFPTQLPLSLVLENPYNASDPWAAIRAINDMYDKNAAMKEELDKNGLVRLGLWTSGAFHFFVGGPYTGLSDVKGKVLRTFGGGRQLMWEKLGAAPMFMVINEVYEALERKVLWGFENTLILSDALKHSEIVKTLVLQYSGMVAAVPVVTTRTMWEKLSPADREIILGVRADFDQRLGQGLIEEEANVINKWKQRGIAVVTPTAADDKTMREAAAAAAIALIEKQDTSLGTPGKGKAVWEEYSGLVKKYEAEIKASGYPWQKR